MFSRYVATAFGERVRPFKVTWFPATVSSVSHTRSGSAREISSMRRTGPRWFVFKLLMSWILASRLAFLSSYPFTSSMIDLRRATSSWAFAMSSSR